MQSPIPLSLYVHFPWCVKKCPYCDFNSHTLRSDLPEQVYVNALIQDFQQQLPDISGRLIESVFMGGGTPSLISPSEIQRLLEALRRSGHLSDVAEITLEANPGAVDEAHFPAYIEAGVNRISIGVQSFDDVLLRAIGRIHSASQVDSAVLAAQAAGFERINLDLMYGLPGQSLNQSAIDIDRALDMDVTHLSVYQLTIEPNTEFAARPPALPDSDQYWAMQEQAQNKLAAAGFEQYEVSAYTRGSACRHNLNYWEFGDYLAIGAGAHGKLSALCFGGLEIERYWNHRHPTAYIEAAKEGDFKGGSKPVPKMDRDFEFLMNALRLKAGFDTQLYRQRTTGSVEALLVRLEPFIDKGWLQQRGCLIQPTDAGYRFLDSMLMEFLPDA